MQKGRILVCLHKVWAIWMSLNATLCLLTAINSQFLQNWVVQVLSKIYQHKKMTFRNSARNIYNSNYNFRLPIYKFSGFISLIYNFQRPKTPSTIYIFLPIASTMYNENKCQIYNVQFDLTPPSNMPCLKFKKKDMCTQIIPIYAICFMYFWIWRESRSL